MTAAVGGAQNNGDSDDTSTSNGGAAAVVYGDTSSGQILDHLERCDHLLTFSLPRLDPPSNSQDDADDVYYRRM